MEKLEPEELEQANLRKKDHLDLAFDAQSSTVDQRFYYEPMMAGHPENIDMPFKFGEKIMRYPIWISSMTGGTSVAGAINKILAKSANKFGFGMGLGSCRIIIEDNTFFDDFNLRPLLGEEYPLFANVGIAQVEKLLENNQSYKLKKLINRLDADGIIVHVNPLQEWLQPEGDLIKYPPINTIINLLNEVDTPLIVKEVGQGFGIESMRNLLKLPLLAVDFAANGGTNFSKLELLRNDPLKKYYKGMIGIGHSAEEMISFLNHSIRKLGVECKCENVIVSGGIKDFLDGYYFIKKAEKPAIYGQASAFLKQAMISQEAVDNYAMAQIKGLLMAQKFLKIR